MTTGEAIDLEVLVEPPDGAGAADLARRAEPVTCGLPFARGALRDPGRLRLLDPGGAPVPVQARALDAWPDGSVRWALLDWPASAGGPGPATYRARVAGAGEPAGPAAPSPVRVAVPSPVEVVVVTGPARFEMRAGGPFPFAAATVDGAPAIDAAGSGLRFGEGPAFLAGALHVEEAGPLRACVRVEGEADARPGPGAGPGPGPRLVVRARLHFFAGSATVRLAVSIANPRRAGHPDGYWELGDPGSVDVTARLALALPAGAPPPAAVRCSPATGAAFESFALPFRLHQASSGGERWRSPVHRERDGRVALPFRGYRLSAAGGLAREGLRATPIASLAAGRGGGLALAVPRFWQNFPLVLEATERGLSLELFRAAELQGGERKTHVVVVAFGGDRTTDEPLAWARAPLVARPAPASACATGAVPWLVPEADDPHAGYVGLVRAAIEGDDRFEAKRERIDEYGWRHFGDIHADHETVFHEGEEPLVSHYNNQYDAIAGFAFQLLRTGDARWFRLMDELAAHVADIDVYHTDEDKAAYNHGLFWHTFHYVDAGLSTHRAYPRAPGVPGGGPANEHCYALGLLMHHFLTGDASSREAALELARFAVDIDDGDRTPFRWLARGATGQASSTADPLYHGPGRGPGNVIGALLVGHRLTGDPALVARAEALIRRCIHPRDDLEALDLLDAERRWSYTVFLQSLGRYLAFKAERGEVDGAYAYARASLLHYARFVAERERPYLDAPDRLEYPTETWVAQDIRKSEALDLAALCTTGAERARFLDRAAYFHAYAVTTLAGMKTRALARPVVILLSSGWLRAYVARHEEAALPAPAEEPRDYGAPETFVPQKARALRRAKLLATAMALAGAGALVAGLVHWLG